jgi:hypothetical protein
LLFSNWSEKRDEGPSACYSTVYQRLEHPFTFLCIILEGLKNFFGYIKSPGSRTLGLKFANKTMDNI